MTHPSQRISHENRGHLLSDTKNAINALNNAIAFAYETGAGEQELAELVWFASRTKAEAIAALAQKINVTDYEILDAMEDPEEHPDLAARLNSLVDGLAEVI